jgi:transposase InsO family protein
MKVRSAIQEIALEHRKRYGYRRITAELRRRGMAVNHRRVARMMQADNLLAIRNCEWLGATDSNTELEIYLNLASRLKISGPNQLWVADSPGLLASIPPGRRFPVPQHRLLSDIEAASSLTPRLAVCLC